jgi:hypothetical protein
MVEKTEKKRTHLDVLGMPFELCDFVPLVYSYSAACQQHQTAGNHQQEVPQNRCQRAEVALDSPGYLEGDVDHNMLRDMGEVVAAAAEAVGGVGLAVVAVRARETAVFACGLDDRWSTMTH